MIYGKLFTYGNTYITPDSKCVYGNDIILKKRDKANGLKYITDNKPFKKNKTNQSYTEEIKDKYGNIISTKIYEHDKNTDIFNIGTHESNDIILDPYSCDSGFKARIICDRNTGICKLHAGAFNENKLLSTAINIDDDDIKMIYLDDQPIWYFINSEGQLYDNIDTGTINQKKIKRKRKRSKYDDKESVLKDNTLIDFGDDMMLIWKQGDYHFDREHIADMKEKWLIKKSEDGIMCPVTYYPLTLSTRVTKRDRKKLYPANYLICGHVYYGKYCDHFDNTCPLCSKISDHYEIQYSITVLDTVTNESADDYEDPYVLSCCHIVSRKQYDIIHKYKINPRFWGYGDDVCPMCPICGNDVCSKSKLYLEEPFDK